MFFSSSYVTIQPDFLAFMHDVDVLQKIAKWDGPQIDMLRIEKKPEFPPGFLHGAVVVFRL
jgi:hypothetical protein